MSGRVERVAHDGLNRAQGGAQRRREAKMRHVDLVRTRQALYLRLLPWPSVVHLRRSKKAVLAVL